MKPSVHRRREAGGRRAVHRARARRGRRRARVFHLGCHGGETASGGVASEDGKKGEEVGRASGLDDGLHGLSVCVARAAWGLAVPNCGWLLAGAGLCRRTGGYDGGMENYWEAVLWSLLPTVVVSVVFFYIVRSVIRMDRTERRAYARIEAQERTRRGMPARAEAAASADSPSAH